MPCSVVGQLAASATALVLTAHAADTGFPPIDLRCFPFGEGGCFSFGNDYQRVR